MLIVVMEEASMAILLRCIFCYNPVWHLRELTLLSNLTLPFN